MHWVFGLSRNYYIAMHCYFGLTRITLYVVAIVVEIHSKTTAQPLSVFFGQGLYVVPSGKCLFDIEILHTEFVLHPYGVNNKFLKGCIYITFFVFCEALI